MFSPLVCGTFSILITPPGATRYCFPPARITAYMAMPPINFSDKGLHNAWLLRPSPRAARNAASVLGFTRRAHYGANGLKLFVRLHFPEPGRRPSRKGGVPLTGPASTCLLYTSPSPRDRT